MTKGYEGTELEYDHGIYSREEAIDALALSLAYTRVKMFNPKADNPFTGFYAFSQDQRDFLTSEQIPLATEIYERLKERK